MSRLIHVAVMDLVKFTTAKLAYEKGYNRLTYGIPHTSIQRHYYNRDGELNGDVTYMIQAIVNGEDVKGFIYDAPAQYVLQKWLRDKHNIFVTVDIDPDLYKCRTNYCADVKNCDSNSDSLGLRLLDGFSLHQSYEEALEEGLYQALKLVDGKK